MEPLEQPVELSAHRARKGELAPLESLVACVVDGPKVGAESFGGVVVVQAAQRRAVAITDTATATAGTSLTGVVASLTKQADRTKDGKRIV